MKMPKQVSTDSAFLGLDEHTFKDLEIFESTSDGISLFQICDRTRTKGGMKVLRRRMEQPWSQGESIHATHLSIHYISKERDTFRDLPSTFATNNVEKYTNEVLPIVRHVKSLDFALGALEFRANQNRYYFDIVRGVQLASGYIRSLNLFLSQLNTKTLEGELEPLIAEMQSILDRPKLASLADTGTGVLFWKVLRLDQTFRLHETDALRRLLQINYEIDALVSMTDATLEHNFVIPTIEEGLTHVRAEGIFHPFLENAVKNSIVLGQEHRILFLTGPNMAGKTTYLRTFSTALYLAHLGMGVPASSFSFVPAQKLFTSFSLSDDLQGGISYFRAEALRVKAVAQAVAEGYRVVAFMDEPFKGTNVKDALDASLAILEGFSSKENCLFVVSSHLIELADRLSSTQQIDYRFFEAEESQGRLGFDYQLHQGVSSQRLGIRVLQEEGIFELLNKT
jgi:DNA mismatch repair protein MutS